MEGLYDSLKNKNVLITGSSRGIGKAIAKQFLLNGSNVIIHCSKENEVYRKTLEEFSNYSGKVVGITANLNDEKEVQRLYSEATKELGNIDILICNASIQIRKAWDNVSYEEYREQMDVNLFSIVKLIQLVAKDMIKNKWGRIITIGSIQQVKPHPDMLIYSASKSALLNVVENLSLQLSSYGITINNIAPGAIYTDRNSEVLSQKEYKEKVINDIPVGFIGESKDCSGIVVSLCSELGRYITGENIFIDGGKHI